MTRVLAIESSCDETGVAVIENGHTILANELASQMDLHAKFGGVVPEIASRQHLRVISQLTRRALDTAGDSIDAVAATNGPGLMGSLLVGVNFAKALAYAWRKPFVPVHHIEGHIFSPFLNGSAPEFPALALIVSGGHTLLIDCRAPHDYKIIATTRDDAVGECFDKVARLLKLPYPGGPSIQNAAEGGNRKAFAFPRAFTGTDTLEFSYSGLKTAVLYTLRDNPNANPADVAASFQEAAVDALVNKTKLAVSRTRAPKLILAGGVAANKRLRERLTETLTIPILMPPISLCMDNAAMIGAAAHSLLQHGRAGTYAATPSASLAL